MTTHDQRTDLNDSYDEAQPATAAKQPLTEPAAPQHSDPAPRADAADLAASEVLVGNGEPVLASSESSTDDDLFADDELAGLRARWDSVQAEFVDDPKACVQKADGLVTDLVEQLTTGFAAARSRLEEQWARGEEASTEDLRVALHHYREFFQRLLAV